MDILIIKIPIYSMVILLMRDLSLEVVLTMLAYKILLPHHFHMIRGNHETEDMNKMYGFEGEVKAKQNEVMFKMLSEVFCSLPLAACMNGKILVLHGGLFSKDNVTFDEYRKIDRFKQPKDGELLMTELLWSDPQDEPGRGISKRGVGLQFGPDVTEQFLSDNNLNLLIRSHEMKDKGYSIQHNGKCITIFSAPNYCDQMNNTGTLPALFSRRILYLNLSLFLQFPIQIFVPWLMPHNFVSWVHKKLSS